MKIKVTKPRKIHKIEMSGKTYGKLVLTLEDLAAFADDDVYITHLEVSRVNRDAIPN